MVATNRRGPGRPKKAEPEEVQEAVVEAPKAPEKQYVVLKTIAPGVKGDMIQHKKSAPGTILPASRFESADQIEYFLDHRCIEEYRKTRVS
jgi:hypothetical protein